MREHQTSRLGLWRGLSALLAFVVVLSAAPAAPAPEVVGDWEGTLDTGSGTLRVVIHISQAKDDSLTGTLDSPDQGVTGITINSIKYKQPDLHFAIERFACSYDGHFNKDSSEIAGQWKQGGASLPLTFKRAGK